MASVRQALRFAIGAGFLAAFLHLGLYLFPSWTLSPRLAADFIHPHGMCQPVDDDWHCLKPTALYPNHVDGGAVAWAELPANYYLSRYPVSERPKWNPFVGPGYPQFLDGHSRVTGWSRIIWHFLPFEKTSDWIVFLRFWIWSAGIGLSCILLGVRRSLVWVAVLSAPILPYARDILDHVYLDVDFLSPWLIALAALPLWFGRAQPVRWRLALGLVFGAGVFVGFQAFVEAQLIFAVGAAMVLAPVATLERSWRLIAALFALGAGFAFAFVPGVLPYVQYFGELTSSRVAGTCYAAEGLGWRYIWDISHSGWGKRPEEMIVFTLPAALLLPLAWRGKGRGLLVAYVLCVIVMAWGWPDFVCGVKGLNGVGVVRHANALTQALFLVLVCAGLTEFFSMTSKLAITHRLPRLARSVGLILAVAAFYPSLKRGALNSRIIEGKAQRAYVFNWQEPGVKSVFRKVRELSVGEDRRHFSPDSFLHPNWGGPLKILETRILQGLYARRQHQLYSAVAGHWTGFSRNPEIPDRFVRIEGDPFVLGREAELEKLLVISRASLLTFAKDRAFPRGFVYSPETCEKLGEDAAAQSWRCTRVGGVGFFPRQVTSVANETELVSLLKKENSEFWLDRAAIVAMPEIQAASGEILGFERDGDFLNYRLRVAEPGLFVVADVYFPGWQVHLNGQKAEIVPVNLAWKGVIVPKGDVELKFRFEPEVSLAASIKAFFR